MYCKQKEGESQVEGLKCKKDEEQENGGYGVNINTYLLYKTIITMSSPIIDDSQGRTMTRGSHTWPSNCSPFRAKEILLLGMYIKFKDIPPRALSEEND